MLVRQDVVTLALADYPALHKQLSGLSEAEVLAALELEAGSRRRSSFLRRLIRRATRLNEIRYKQVLKERYMAHDPSEIMKAKIDRKKEPIERKKPKPKPKPGKKK